VQHRRARRAGKRWPDTENVIRKKAALYKVIWGKELVLCNCHGNSPKCHQVPVIVGQRAGQTLLEINAQSAVTGLDQEINTLAVDLWQGSVSKKRLVRRLLAAVSADAGNLSLKG